VSATTSPATSTPGEPRGAVPRPEAAVTGRTTAVPPGSGRPEVRTRAPEPTVPGGSPPVTELARTGPASGRMVAAGALLVLLGGMLVRMGRRTAEQVRR
jgi:hypothetical protein